MDIDAEPHGERSPFLSHTKKKKKCNSSIIIGAVAVGFIFCLLVFFIFYYGFPLREINVIVSTNPTHPTSASVVTTTPSIPHSQIFNTAAVAADAGRCSVIGKDILLRGGSAVDAAIAAMLCVGLLNAQSAGIGGGFFMTVYHPSSEKGIFIDGREVAPKAATVDMYHGNKHLSAVGSGAVAVPGEISGYWKAHQLYGKLPWKDLFVPSIKLAQNGFVVGSALADAIAYNADVIHNRTFNLWPVFENDDGSLKTEGDIIRRPQLAKTLQTIAEEGSAAFYSGSLTDDVIKDLEDAYGTNYITAEDLNEYQTQIKDTLHVDFDDVTLFSPGPPASGSVLALILNILNGYNFTKDNLKDDKSKILTYHRIVEAFRFGYAKRSLLGDERGHPNITAFVKKMTTTSYADALRSKITDWTTHPVAYYHPDFELTADHGTSHLSVIGPDGDAVAMTSTVNLLFGSLVRGSRTGIIFNNQMDDFSSPNITNPFGLPPSPDNFIKPGNRPFSSMCPSVLVKRNGGKNAVKLVVGASGGTIITTSVVLTILDTLFFGFSAGESVEKKRIHDQLMPNLTQVEEDFGQAIVEGLRGKGHKVEIKEPIGSEVQAILVLDDGRLDAASDSRKGGFPAGY